MLYSLNHTLKHYSRNYDNDDDDSHAQPVLVLLVLPLGNMPVAVLATSISSSIIMKDLCSAF